MLPALPQAFGNLKDVFRSAYDSINGRPNPLNLPRVKNALVIMVDGLGWENINQFPGHAPFMKKHMTKQSKGFSGFPSTTASSIVSLATGAEPSLHGFIGYRIFDREKSESVNLLTGLDSNGVSRYLNVPNLSEQAQTVVVSRPEYRDSGFSYATFPNARFLGEEKISSRFDVATEELNSGSGKIIYLYVPELDQTAHRFGSRSEKWVQLLELVDSQLKKLIATVQPNRGVVLTADHGVIDVPNEGHIYLDECQALSGRLLDVGGDPRATFLYFAPEVEIQGMKRELRAWLGEAAHVVDVSELVEAGLYSSDVLAHSNIKPDLVVLAGTKRATYHRNFAKPASLNMIGQHGGVSVEEITIPILKLASYSSSLLVP